MADVLISQQAALAAASDPTKTAGGKGGKGGKGKGGGGKGKGKGAGQSAGKGTSPLGGLHPSNAEVDTTAAGTTSVNDTPKRRLNFLNLFSGPYLRANGLSNRLRYFGWTNVTDIDNDTSSGGGWADDIMNDSKFSHLLKQAKDGDFDSMMIAFPCTTFSIARFFDAPDQNGNRGPEPIRDKDNPDGIPEDRLTPAQINP